MGDHPCVTHCPSGKGGVLRGPLLAFGALAAAALAVYVASALASAVAAVTVAVLAVDAAGVVVLVRLLRPARNARVIRAQSAVPQNGGRNENRAAITAPPRAIGAARAVPGVALGVVEADKVRP